MKPSEIPAILQPAFRSGTSEVELCTLAQLTRGEDWRLELAHDRNEHLLIWITKGQGIALFQGARRGVGSHNALFVPAGELFSLQLGRQSYGHAVIVPPGAGLNMPGIPWHLRIRDVLAQKELTGLFDGMQREHGDTRTLHADAMSAHATLMGIWLQRHLDEAAPAPEGRSNRLMRQFCARIASHHHTGQSLAEHAATLDVTATHLNRVCRAELGKTASALLNERILHAVRSLLADTDAPVGNVARHLGFGSAAYFSRYVVQHTGLPPSALRKAAQAARAHGNGSSLSRPPVRRIG